MDPSENPTNQNAQTCPIHQDVHFAIDEECPRCLDEHENFDFAVYQDYIAEQNTTIKMQSQEIQKLRKRISEVAYTERDI